MVFVKVILFGNKVFADFIQVKMRSYWIRMGPNPMSGVFIRERRRRFRPRHREQESRYTLREDSGRVMMEAEIGVMQLQTKEHKGSRATTRN